MSVARWRGIFASSTVNASPPSSSSSSSSRPRRLRSSRRYPAGSMTPPPIFEPAGDWFDPEIRRFVRIDAADPPPKRAALFVGSSIFREWRESRDFDADFAPTRVINRAFGGSTTEDLLRVVDAIATPHDPEIIVYYCGSNDVSEGRGAAAIRDAFAAFCDRGETASHTTPFAWCTPFLKDFSRRHSSPALPFQRLTGKTFD